SLSLAGAGHPGEACVEDLQAAEQGAAHRAATVAAARKHDMSAADTTGGATPKGQSPKDQSPAAEAARHEAECLLERVQALMPHLARGEAGLIGAHVYVVSSDAVDWLFARLLTCYGARVVFVCSGDAEHDSPRHIGLASALVQVLRTQCPYL